MAGDFNNDGLLDVAAIAGSHIAVFLGNGDGTFQPERVLSFANLGKPISLVAADFNRDGILDLAVADSESDSFSVLLGNGDGTFVQTGGQPVSSHTVFVDTADFNSDGKLDLAAVGTDGDVSIYPGNGDGTFREGVRTTARGNTALALGDFNGDGKMDLAVADWVKRSVTVILQSSARPDRNASSAVSSEATRTAAILAAVPQASVLATTSCTTPRGTTLTESFGDSAARCWAGGPASCDQLWAVGSGSAQSITAAPAGAPANTACSNSLTMNQSSGTRGYVYTTGTFPTLPAGTTFDVFFTLYISSSSLGAYRIEPLFYASQDKGGGTSAGIIHFYANGSTLQLTASGATFASDQNITLNAWHQIQLHIAPGSGSSYLKVDGNPNQTFTATSAATNFFLFGNSTGATDAISYSIGNLYVNSALTGGPPPSAYIDFEGGANGAAVSTSAMASGTHCGNGQWSLSSNATAALSFSSSGQKTLHSAVTTCGTTYTDSAGTLGLAYDLSKATGQYARYAWNSIAASASASFFFRMTLPATDMNWYTLGGIEGAAVTDYAYLHENGSGSQLRINLETKSGLTSSSIPISPNTWYWCTMQYNAGGTHQLTLYETTNWTVLGTLSSPASGTVLPASIAFGRPGSESGLPSAFLYFDNIVIDYSGGRFPVAP